MLVSGESKYLIQSALIQIRRALKKENAGKELSVTLQIIDHFGFSDHIAVLAVDIK